MNQVERRKFLNQLGMVGAVGVSKSLFPRWMPRLAFRQQQNGPRGDVLVVIFLRGGMDGLCAVAPYGDGSHYYEKRPTQNVAEPGAGENAAIDLDGYFGLHPTLAPLKEIYDEGELSIVHATGSIDPTRSHFDAMQFMEFGVPGDKTIGTGWLGRHLESAAWQNDSPFRAVGMGAILQDSLRGDVSPLTIESFADYHLRGRSHDMQRIQQTLAQLYSIQAPQGLLTQQSDLVFQTIDTLAQLSAVDYQPLSDADYPDGEFGMGLRQIAQLIKADVGLEVACVDVGGWDTHENQGTFDGTFNALLNQLGRGMAAFYADLHEYMPNITVVTMSEFGRTVNENGSAGTDHGHGNVMFLMGGGVIGGQVFADWPTLAPDRLDSDGDLAITTDYRDVLANVISTRLLNESVDHIFPNHTIQNLNLVRPRA